MARTTIKIYSWSRLFLPRKFKKKPLEKDEIEIRIIHKMRSLGMKLISYDTVPSKRSGEDSIMVFESKE
jgi:hypothetical protein